MAKRTCALEDCEVEFEPRIDSQKYCSSQHSALSRVRRMRARRPLQSDAPPPDGGGSGLYATIGGAVSTRQKALRP